ncbi:hypothetical protein ACFZDK_33845 [Streptomyces sp. NPDC007901]|uniref:hypothetical protein n=1 Tax=Streptomyces sp. NPDC007901 TaxID=3364785 RepID=UPI0036E81192
MAADSSLLAPAMVTAALVIRTDLSELRNPGSARAQWAFATDHRAVAAGAAVATAVLVLGWQQIGGAAAVWGLLIGALTAQLVDGDGNRP